MEVQPPPPAIAQSLGLKGGNQVISRHQQRSIDGTPYSMQTTYYPMKFVTEKGATRLLEARDIEGGVVDYLRRLGIDQIGWRDQFILRPPDGNERTFFNLSDRVQVAMLCVQRTGYDEEGNPIRVTVTIYPGDRNQFEMEAGKVPQGEMKAGDVPPAETEAEKDLPPTPGLPSARSDHRASRPPTGRRQQGQPLRTLRRDKHFHFGGSKVELHT